MKLSKQQMIVVLFALPMTVEQMDPLLLSKLKEVFREDDEGIQARLTEIMDGISASITPAPREKEREG